MTASSLAVRLASRTSEMHGSIIDSSTSLLAGQRHDIVRFAMGAPNAELIPEAEFTRLLALPTPGRFDYGATEGEPALLEQLQRLQGDADPERLLVTTGGMQGLDIAFKLFVDAGDAVVVEAPTYTNGIGTAMSYRPGCSKPPPTPTGSSWKPCPTSSPGRARPPRWSTRSQTSRTRRAPRSRRAAVGSSSTSPRRGTR